MCKPLEYVDHGGEYVDPAYLHGFQVPVMYGDGFGPECGMPPYGWCEAMPFPAGGEFQGEPLPPQDQVVHGEFPGQAELPNGEFIAEAGEPHEEAWETHEPRAASAELPTQAAPTPGGAASAESGGYYDGKAYGGKQAKSSPR